MASKEVENLVKLLQTYKNIYSTDEVIQAVMAEGYSRKIARDVIDELYGKGGKKQEIKNESKSKDKVNQNKEESGKDLTLTSKDLAPTKAPEPTVDSSFSEVDKLMSQLKNSIQLAPPEENLGEELSKLQEENIKLAEQEEKKTVEPDKVIENPQNYKDKDVSEIPRRLRRFYRPGEPQDKEQSQATETDPSSRHYRERLKELKGKPNTDEELETPRELRDNIIDVIYSQVKEKTDLNKPKEEIEKITEVEVERFRDRHNREPNQRGEINQIVDNIFTQLTRDEEIKKIQGTGEDKPAEKDTKKEEKKEETNPFDLNMDLPNFNLDKKISDNDLGDLDLNLNLDLEPPKKKEEKKESDKK
ncbi:MAG: hypothetical protein PHH82_03510 [Candidatus ainarchaeum sp.]|nr:hypothetical protein [Candidatus ainarchaeum sp.]